MQIKETAGPAMVWVRVGNVRTTALLAQFEVSWDLVVLALRSGERVVELR